MKNSQIFDLTRSSCWTNVTGSLNANIRRSHNDTPTAYPVILTPLWSCPADRPRPPGSCLLRSSWCRGSTGHRLRCLWPQKTPGWCEAWSCSSTRAVERWSLPHAGSPTSPCRGCHCSKNHLKGLFQQIGLHFFLQPEVLTTFTLNASRIILEK